MSNAALVVFFLVFVALVGLCAAIVTEVQD